jgi:hypothetical protein
VHRCGRGSDARANKSASTPLPYWRRPSRRRLGVGGNVCLSIFQIGSMVFSPFLRSSEICFSMCRWRLSFSAVALGAGARWVLWSEDVGTEVVDLSLFPNIIGEMRWFLVQESTGTSPGRRPQRHVPRCLQRVCSSTHKASLAMVLFWIWQWRRLDVSSNVRPGGVGVWRRPLLLTSAEKSRDSSIFFYSLGFSMQSVKDNCFFFKSIFMF